MSAIDEAAPADHEAAWHDVECGGYAADLALWDELAAGAAGTVLELGSGTGRVALRLAAAGYDVAALDSSPALLAELARRAAEAGVEIATVLADARDLPAEPSLALIAAPMQFAHLLDGPEGRRALFEHAFEALVPGGRIALAILAELAVVSQSGPPPLPDVREIDGWVYSSLPIEVRFSDGALEVRRLRQLVAPDGTLSEQLDSIRLDLIDADELEAEARAVGFSPAERIAIPATEDHVGSIVVVLERQR